MTFFISIPQSTIKFLIFPSYFDGNGGAWDLPYWSLLFCGLYSGGALGSCGCGNTCVLG